SEEIAAAKAYNKSLIGRYNAYLLPDEQKQQYEKLLNIGGDGIMAIIEIPTIDLLLPIYHGTEENVLQVAVGHLEWTSLPIGGENTHCVVSSHRGLPSARLFTDIDQLTVGDHVYIRVLNEQHCYEVDKITIVEPDDTKDLLIEEGKDLLTLVTCTPYGINSHRLLVRGHRISAEEEAKIVRVTADAMIIDKLIVAPFVLLPLVIILLLWFFKNKKGGSNR
ncbi:MAG: class C sortase, partial [Christensenellaceae bacterium]|nr:class C sortase [Christensenellaceae bacterium]